MEIERHAGTSFARLTGVEGAQARAVQLRLGEETIELLAFTEPGAPYPADIGCGDLRFQHIAIVVADMESAYLRLRACEGWSAITSPAPQRLPATSGGATAFKFRDPERHPLELLAFPPNNVPSRWREARIETVHALGSITPPSSFLARPQASRSSSRSWDFPSPGARSIAAGSCQPSRTDLLELVSASSRLAS
jgi:hypothetical protein